MSRIENMGSFELKDDAGKVHTIQVNQTVTIVSDSDGESEVWGAIDLSTICDGKVSHVQFIEDGKYKVVGTGQTLTGEMPEDLQRKLEEYLN